MKYSPGFDSFRQTLMGTAAVAAVCLTQVGEALAKTGEEIYQIAVPITVQINSQNNGGGTGVIVSQSGDTYTVVTNHHVVCQRGTFVSNCNTNGTYQIITHRGRTYTASFVQAFQGNRNEPDLAIVRFRSSDSYPVATLGDSQQIIPGSEVYVYGFPSLLGRRGSEREPEFTQGFVTSRPQNRSGGYAINYSALTWGGMSGGPVFDSEGRLIGIHGEGVRDWATVYGNDGQTRTGIANVAAGINSAIPINTFVALQPRIRQGDVRLAVDAGSRGRVANLDNPSTASDYYARGAANYGRGNFRAAINDFTQSLRLDGNNRDAYIFRGVARFDQKDYEGAIADYNRALQIDNNYADAYVGRGLARRQQGDLQGAIADYNRALQIDNNYAYAYVGRGNVHRNQGDYEGAIADFNRALQIDPNSADAYHNRGATRVDQKDYEGAIADFNQALQIDNNYAEAYVGRGNVHHDQGDYEGAIADFNRALQIDSDSAEAYHGRGTARYMLGDKQKARSDWQTAANLYRQQGNDAGYQLMMDTLRNFR
ncbi:tetratricopeptide repeat-containing serine protease family protein [Lyngbya sp. CCY1209]|uniref:tetratricopeptide repeat-containing serine protease family protein n=1 Tax=Lyngbya sp. CCY1209 TaxID=2886103 RepID=UPI002D20A9EB|nr:tetratricopeptide repeat-containing serine protease family protein [Lyngbya sp. CCY1209]MEB3886897.1 tetratricopeptide repeat-containing serine protease family protein [Lyngbya sp. CCY1209]